MPRGPGKATNYNLDYSRFNGVKPEEDKEAETVEPNLPSNMPSMQELLWRAPPELREAHHLLMAGRANNDADAERRANELVLDAMEKASPEVQRDFIRELGRHQPEAAEAIANAVNAPRVDPLSCDPKDLGNTIETLRKEMEVGAEATRKQLEGLQRQQEALEHLKTPEDVLKFMHEQGGMTEEDLKRIFSGDQQHMEKCMTGMLDKALMADEASKKAQHSEKAVARAEELHAALMGRETQRVAAPDTNTDQGKLALPPTEEQEVAAEEVKIPDHRLQYERDAESRYTAVKFRCSMPGVEDMSVIMLDVSEKHIRLHTCSPAPRYAVNAGPFPVLIDPNRAKAKYSKRRAELSVEVPAKADP